jgi:Raf kinase inhibitor-like YbhB/YbcL family protein
MKKTIGIFLALVSAIAWAGEARMELASSAFKTGASIPAVYTCDGRNVAPPLAWSGVPAETKSFALIADDPDAPSGTWVHWVLWNLPTSANSIPETGTPLPAGALEGKNDFGDAGYGGPCPPSGTHRYFFKLYALGTTLTLKPGVTKATLEKAMNNHILAKAELVGTYQR